MAMSATFCCTARSGVGGGHVIRSLTLADALATRGWDISFAVPPEALVTAKALPAAGYPIVPVASADAAGVEALRACAPLQRDLFVLDLFTASAAADRAARDLARRTMALDDAAMPDHACDLVISSVSTPSPHNGVAEVLHGPQYAVLDARYARARARLLPNKATRARWPYRVMTFFGLTDHHGVTLRILRGLARLHPGIVLDVVLGSAAPTFAEVRKESERASHRVVLHADLAMDQMVDLTAQADLAVGAGGGAALERCTLGVPSILTATADNQLAMAASLAAVGAVRYLGPDAEVSEEDFADGINDLCGSPRGRARMGAAAAAVCDGRGTERVVAAIKSLCGAP